jgi:enoyl-CoA hydratase
MANECVRYVLEGTTAIVHMDDGKVNVLSEGMIEGLEASLERAEREASAMVLIGRPERFSAGFDLRVMMSSPQAAIALFRRGADLLMKLYGAKVPLVIACTGHALAAGALMLLTGDVRIGQGGAFKIGLNEVTIGLPVPILAMELARDRLVAAELGPATMMAKIYAPEEAAKVGYLDFIASESEIRDRAKTEAMRLGSLSRPAYEATKTRLRGDTIAHILATLDDDMKSLIPASSA